MLEIKNGKVYYEGVEITGADPETIRVIETYISKDKSNVYYKDMKISNLDAGTFKVQRDNGEIFLYRDKNGMYLDTDLQNMAQKNSEN